jgi:hypothetical protein
MRDWVIYVGIMIVGFAIVFRDRLTPGPFIGLLVSGPIYLLFGGVLAKFGYQRKTLRDIRRETDEKRAAAAAPVSTSATRARPAPTSRTGGGRPASSSKRKKR